MAELRRSSAQGTVSRLVFMGECRFDGGAGQLWRGADAIKLTRRTSGTDAYDCYLRGLARLSPATADSAKRALQPFTQTTDLVAGMPSPYADVG